MQAVATDTKRAAFAEIDQLLGEWASDFPPHGAAIGDQR